jgi:carboxynorspermidine decarboxylase
LNFNEIPSPCYVIDERLLRKNLSLIRSVKERANITVILAFKAFATWKAFPIIREYIPCSTASSIYEAQLAWEEMDSKAHTYSPAYTESDFPSILKYSSHITFNSLTQYERFQNAIARHPEKISCGLRINPECSLVATDLYNPASPQSRLGMLAANLPELPQGVEGLHFHVLCESSSYDLEKALTAVEEKFGRFLPQIRWLNMGGGHLMTRQDYDVEHLISLLTEFKQRHPNVEIILEPGSAFLWQTGVLVADVVDIVVNDGMATAILNISFTCHLPDCLEMPYKPTIRHATDETADKPTYRMGGNSCLAGDYAGCWSFDKPLKVGDKIIFEDMIHYTTVKTTMFNGIQHPSIGIWTIDNKFNLYRQFQYSDYKNRMS